MKKFILLMLVTALAALPVLSCAADEDGITQPEPGLTDEIMEMGMPVNAPDDGVGEGSEELLRFPDLPDIHFEGHEFRIINVAEDQQTHILKTLVVEEETGHALNDAILRRNRRMEDRFGFSLTQIDATGPAQVQSRMRTSIQAGSDDFDLGMTGALQALAMAQEGFIEMIDRIPYIDLSQPWWDQDMIRDFSIGGRIFFISGDFSFNQYSVTMATYFNKQLHGDLGLDCPYQLVHEGRWTMDRFAEMGRAGLRDLNGDGIFDYRDQWGFLSGSHVFTVAFMNGMGARFVTKDADDMPVLNVSSEGFINRFHVLFDILTENWAFDRRRLTIGSNIDQQEMFLNNHALFWTELMNQATFLRVMDSDFGILPQPKFNEQQDHHISGTGIPHVMAIPVTSPDLERTGIILEALSAESRLTTLHVYFDTMLVNQIMNRDEESAEMLEIIFANRIYETGRQFWASQVVNPIYHAVRDLNRDIVSVIERNEGAATAAIEATIAAFLDN